MSDSLASARSVRALHQDHTELSCQVVNLQCFVHSFAYDQQFTNQVVESLVERCNILSTEVRLLQQSLARHVQQAQVERDALHLRIRVLEQRLDLHSLN